MRPDADARAPRAAEPGPTAPAAARSPAPATASLVLKTGWGTAGDLATSAFVIAALSGVAVAIPYDTADAYGSIAGMLLADPWAVFFRNLHYWAGQACLVLTLLHVWDHLRAGTEQRVTRGVWLRLTLALPLLGFLMLSGFILRGDADARQALRIVTGATALVPGIGPLLATLAFGTSERLHLLYVQHAATATIVVWVFIVEHARRVWPRFRPTLAMLAATAGLSLVVSPGLHDGLDPIVKGPWYFLGLQEILHWASRPIAVVMAGLAILGAFAAIRLSGPRAAAWVKRALVALAAVYAALCLVGGLLRGEDWSFAPTWPAGGGNLRAGFVFTPTVPAPSPLPTAMDRPEGCLVCHKGVTGLGVSHRPEAVGCASCHGGDPLTLDTARAHAGMDLVPGNLANARLRCGQPECHPAVIPRVKVSVMETMSGVVAVDRTAFGEPPGTAGGRVPTVSGLGHSAADTHLRQLCASCHLGQVKSALGPNGEDARGGGCEACHLRYSPEALKALGAYEAAKLKGPAGPPTVHPAVSLDIDDAQCFGCHSRSGRISTSYEGWQEMHDPPAGASDPNRPGPSVYRVLADERVFERELPDIHQQLGMDCVDCHTAIEVMGDGVAHARKSGQLRVACVDCHARAGTSLDLVPAARIDPESRKILAIRQWPGAAPVQFGRTASGDLLVNVVAGATGPPAMIRKRTGQRLPLKPALAVCAEGRGHARLSCESCHTAWAPRCPTCHTSFDPKADAYDWVDDADVSGAWKETSGPFSADPPTLGVREIASRAGTREVIDTFVPGMVMTLDRNRRPGGPPDVVFRRLYARIAAHTTRRESRSCTSCHDDPEAIGYGRGTLRYERAGAVGRWRFMPAAPAAPADGLPGDAWIPFLGARAGRLSTRDDVRPFTVEEQRRILRVGACLTCHPGDSAVMRESVRDFDALLRRRSARCLLPAWN